MEMKQTNVYDHVETSSHVVKNIRALVRLIIILFTSGQQGIIGFFTLMLMKLIVSFPLTMKSSSDMTYVFVVTKEQGFKQAWLKSLNVSLYIFIISIPTPGFGHILPIIS